MTHCFDLYFDVGSGYTAGIIGCAIVNDNFIDCQPLATAETASFRVSQLSGALLGTCGSLRIRGAVDLH